MEPKSMVLTLRERIKKTLAAREREGGGGGGKPDI